MFQHTPCLALCTFCSLLGSVVFVWPSLCHDKVTFFTCLPECSFLLSSGEWHFEKLFSIWWYSNAVAIWFSWLCWFWSSPRKIFRTILAAGSAVSFSLNSIGAWGSKINPRFYFSRMGVTSKRFFIYVDILTQCFFNSELLFSSLHIAPYARLCWSYLDQHWLLNL